ncbi:hypothetical protein Trydic_g15090 [Trypoxylus dichotomus]
MPSGTTRTPSPSVSSSRSTWDGTTSLECSDTDADDEISDCDSDNGLLATSKLIKKRSRKGTIYKIWQLTPKTIEIFKSKNYGKQ